MATTAASKDAFIPFELERYQGRWENVVRYNLAESGVHPLTVAELLEITDTDPAQLHAVGLGYSQTDGTPALRDAIARMYPGATRDNVLVTVGSSEANFATVWALVGPGDAVAVQVPTYLQAWGLARNLGAEVSTFSLVDDGRWSLDAAALEAAVRPGTRLVVVTNPNNPTGKVLTPGERKAVVDRVADTGAWLLADEVYRGAERDGALTETFWGSGPRTVVTGGLSKAYGLPGLRIGWVVGPRDLVEMAGGRHDYLVIGPSIVSDLLATRALAARDRLLERTRGILTRNLPIVEEWMASFGNLFRWTRPAAGAIVYARYDLPVESFALAERVRTGGDTLIVPGSHFHMPGYVRLGFGEPPGTLEPALDAVGGVLRDLLRG